MVLADWTNPQGLLFRGELSAHPLPGFVFLGVGPTPLTICHVELKNMKKVPVHLAESVFRRYEPVLVQLVANPGHALRIEIPPGLSPKTVAARIRDAVNSHITYRWTPTPVDPDKLAGLRKTFVVRQFSDCVEIDFSGGESTTNRTVVATAMSTLSETVVPLADATDLHALARLLSKRLVQGPFRIVNCLDADVKEVESLYDIGVVRNVDNSVTII